MSLPARLLFALLSLLLAFAGGWATAIRYRAGVDAADALARAESARETERLAARHQARITDAYLKERLSAAASGAELRQRLREQSQRGADSATVQACRDDGEATAARLLPDDVGRDLVSLMEEAERVSAGLRACLEPAP